MTADWIRLCELLDDDPELVAAVRRALADPPGSDVWTAVLDGLDDGGALAYLDREDTGSELADALAGVPRVFRAGADLASAADIDDLDAAIAQADTVLSAHGLRLVHLHEDPDVLPLVVVPTENAGKIVALAGKLGHEARTFG